jgi:AbrB family looped-hinge helix DNA binding protein
VLQKGKITIPAEIRDKLGISEGDYVKLEIEGNRIVLYPPRTVLNPTELLTGLAEGASVKEPAGLETRKASATRVEKKLSRSAR